MTKTIYEVVVRREGNQWITAVDVPNIGIVNAIAEEDWQIDRHARISICDYTEEDPFDFDLTYEFIDEAPTYLMKD